MGQLNSGKSDLPLSVNAFQEYDVCNNLLECIKLNDGIEKIVEPILNKTRAFNNLISLLRSTAIKPADLKILYYRREAEIVYL